MNLFVVVSFGKTVFRTCVIRRSLNPQWDKKMLLHVHRYETTSKVQLAVWDWDKLSFNDHVDTSFYAAQLLVYAPKKDPTTSLYSKDEDGA